MVSIYICAYMAVCFQVFACEPEKASGVMLVVVQVICLLALTSIIYIGCNVFITCIIIAVVYVYYLYIFLLLIFEMSICCFTSIFIH